MKIKPPGQEIAEMLSVIHLCGCSRAIPVPVGVPPRTIESINQKVPCPSCAKASREQKKNAITAKRGELGVTTPAKAVKTSISFPDLSLWLAFRSEALRRGETVSAVLARLAIAYLDREKGVAS